MGYTGDIYVIVILAKKVFKWISTKLSKKRILILGTFQTGKTALHWLIKYKRPYQLLNGQKERIPPSRTSGIAVIGKKAKIGRKKIKKLMDVGGELSYRFQWTKLIEEVDPHGIIYMIDGCFEQQVVRSGENIKRDTLEESIDELFSDVISHYYRGKQELEALHVLINFLDQWAGNDPEKIKMVVNDVTKCFYNKLSEDKNRGRKLKKIPHFGFSAVHLDPDDNSWEEAILALQRFSDDLH